MGQNDETTYNFFKLDFSKYDKVSSAVFFEAIHWPYIHEIFIKWIKMFFLNIWASITLNSCNNEEFKVERGVTQGCPMAPYCILIVGEVFNHIIKKSMRERENRSS